MSHHWPKPNLQKIVCSMSMIMEKPVVPYFFGNSVSSIVNVIIWDMNYKGRGGDTKLDRIELNYPLSITTK